MKRFLKLLSCAAMCATLAIACDKYDDSALTDRVSKLEDRVSALEKTCQQINSDIVTLKQLVEALQNNDYVTNVTEVVKDGKVIGYTLTFNKRGPVTIYHGENGKDGANGKDGKDGENGKDGQNGQDGKDGADGKDGKDGYTPQIGVRQDSDGIWYWTLDGEWLLDSSGNKIKAVGTDGRDGVDGKDGQNGQDGKDGQNGTDGKDGENGQDGKPGADGKDGQNGKDGKDGVTPQLKIEDGYWFISYDNGQTWSVLGKATGDNGRDGVDGANGQDGKDGKDGQNGADGKDGKDGQDGKDGDSMFRSVSQDDSAVYLVLSDGTEINIPKQPAFAVSFDRTDISALKAGESMTVSYTITGADEKTLIRAYGQDGWRASVIPASQSEGSIKIYAPNPLTSGEILVLVNDGGYRTIMSILSCEIGELNLSCDAIDAASAGGNYEVNVRTNLDYSVNIPSSAASWLSHVQTKAMREETIVFSVAENPDITSRYATVTLTDSKGEISQTIVVTQRGASLIEGAVEIHVATKGTLHDILEDYDKANIKAMKITGVLNDVDLMEIRLEMPSLTDLDLSEVAMTALPDKCFYQSTTIKNIILPKSLVSIGANAFASNSLKNVQMYNSLETIGASAFASTKLTSILIPASVQTIGANAFSGCTAAATITFEDNCSLIDLADGVFASCPITEIRISANVETISTTAFSGCPNLSRVTFEEGAIIKTVQGFNHPSLTYIEIPPSAETIGGFSGATGLSTVIFAENSNLNEIADGAFTGCNGLTSIEIPASVTKIGANAFGDCKNLKKVIIPEDSKLKIIGGGYKATVVEGAFHDCTSLESIYIPASVETIGYNAFYKCTNLAKVDFGKNSRLKEFVGTVDDYNCPTQVFGIFSGCTSLSEITIPSSIESIGAGTFEGSGLQKVFFEENSKLSVISGSTATNNKGASTSRGAFKDCKSLEEIVIPASVKEIQKCAFYGCTSLKKLSFEDDSTLSEIGGDIYSYTVYGSNEIFLQPGGSMGAFNGCTSLTSVTLPSSLKKIGECAFYGCPNLKEIKFSSNSQLATIEQFAFDNCAKISRIDLSNCLVVNSIGYKTFNSSKNLVLVQIGTVVPPTVDATTFQEVSTSTLLKVPTAGLAAYKSTDYWKKFSSISSLDD